jgi:SAM-dependent methyltransferase
MKLSESLKSLLLSYARLFGGIPYRHLWTDFIKYYIQPSSIVVDVGGGKGEFANYLGPKLKWIFILDKEGTSRMEADSSLFTGSLALAYKNRQYQNIIPVKGDAIAMPFADNSLDLIVCCDLIEHLDNKEKNLFFKECRRTLKAGGIFFMSTPNADYIKTHSFWFPGLLRRLIPKRWMWKLPSIMRGPWLEQSVEDWETKIGHYDRGCELNRILLTSEGEGFERLNHRFFNTPLTFFWLQLMFTLPFFYLLFIPVVRLFYLIESWSNISKRDGATFMIIFRKSMNSSINVLKNA